MTTAKLFKVVGVSKLKGEYKIRFANDVMRIKVLAKNGHEDIRLAELEEAVTKFQAVQQIADMAEFQDAAAQTTIADYLDANEPKAADPAVHTQAEAEAEVVAEVVAEAELA
jgi:hypothetical protein